MTACNEPSSCKKNDLVFPTRRRHPNPGPAFSHEPCLYAISVLQPWASLIACGAKTHLGVPDPPTRGLHDDGRSKTGRPRTRGPGLSYRGPILIHASKTVSPWGKSECGDPSIANALARAGYDAFRGYSTPDVALCSLPRGCVVAVAVLADVVPWTLVPAQSKKRWGRYGDAKPQSRTLAHLVLNKTLDVPVAATGWPRVFQIPGWQEDADMAGVETLDEHAPREPCWRCGGVRFWQSLQYPEWSLCLTCRPKPVKCEGRELTVERVDAQAGWFDPETAGAVHQDLEALAAREQVKGFGKFFKSKA